MNTGRVPVLLLRPVGGGEAGVFPRQPLYPKKPNEDLLHLSSREGLFCGECGDELAGFA